MRKNLFLLLALFICNMSYGQVVSTGLVSYYKFEGSATNGNFIVDETENDNDASITDNVLFSKDRSGIDGQAIVLGGEENNSYLTINSDFNRPSINALENFSVSFWYNKTDNTGSGVKPVLTIKDTEGKSYSLEYIIEEDKIQWSHYNGSVKGLKISSSVLSNDKWYFVAFTVDVLSGKAQLYIDGNLQGESSGQITKPTNPSFTLAADPGVSISGFPASYDDLYIYNKVLKLEEIYMVKNNCKVLPASPVVSDAFRCGPGNVNIQSTSDIAWYLTSNGGTPIYKGKSFNPIVSTSTIYYISGTTNEGCESPVRTPVKITINPLPELPVIQNGSHCGPGNVNLTVTGVHEYKWYDAPTGGVALAEGNSYTTPVLSASVSYYVSSVSVEGCESASRSQVTAYIKTIPVAPIASNASRCGHGSLTLSAIGEGAGSFVWYEYEAGGDIVAYGSNFVTPELSATKTYYVASISAEGCESATKVPAVATINAVPEKPVAYDASRCGQGPVTLSATGGFDYLWYVEAAGGSPVSKGTVFTTPVLNTPTSFYVSNLLGDCESERVEVKAIIKPIPSIPILNITDFRCGPGSLTFNLVGDLDFRWYSEDGILVGYGNTFTTPVLEVTTKYYIDYLPQTECFNVEKGTAIATIVQIPELPEITGDKNVEENSIHIYNIDAPGNLFEWAIEGGTGSSNTNQIEVKWLGVGTGKITVSAISGPYGCQATQQLEVIKGAIVAGATVPEEIVNETKVFPNPSNGSFVIDCPFDVEEVVLTNMLGQTRKYYSKNIDAEFKGLVIAEIKTSRGIVFKKIELK